MIGWLVYDSAIGLKWNRVFRTRGNELRPVARECNTFHLPRSEIGDGRTVRYDAHDRYLGWHRMGMMPAEVPATSAMMDASMIRVAMLCTRAEYD